MVDLPKLASKSDLRPTSRGCAKTAFVGTVLQPVWISLVFSYIWFASLIIIRLCTDSEFTHDERWHVSHDVRKLVEGFVQPAMLATQGINLFFASLYSTGSKRSPALAAALHCILAALTLALDAHSLLFHPGALDLSLYGLIAASGSFFYLALTTLMSMRYGEAKVAEVRKDRVVVAFCFWLTLWPIPHIILKLSPPRSLALAGLAAAIDVVILSGYAVLGVKVWAKLKLWLDIHWVVPAVGLATFLIWCAADLQLMAIGMGRAAPPYGALLAHTILVVVMYLQLSLFVSQSITSFEEGSRFKAERDAMERELAARLENEQRLRAAEDARQKFLRYVFHEIRVPFNSIDMGLTMLVEDVHAEDAVFSEQKRHGLLHAIHVSGRRRRRGSQDAPQQPCKEGRSSAEGTQASAQSCVLSGNGGSSFIPSAHPSLNGYESPLPAATSGTSGSNYQANTAAMCTRHHLPDDAVVTLERIVKATESMKVIINDTLDWTKLQSGAFSISPGPVDLPDVITTSVTGLTPMAQHGDFKVQLSAWVDPRMPACVMADTVRLQQVVSNFLSNAIKFAPHDGTGRVTVSAYLVTGNLQEGEQGQTERMNGFDGAGVWWKDAVPEAADTAVTVGQAGTEQVQVHQFGQGREDKVHASLLPHLVCPVLTKATHQKLLDQGYSFLSVPRDAQETACPDPNPLVCCDGQLDKASGRQVGQAADATAIPACVRCCTVVLSVKDNGGGFHPSESGLLFSAFRQLDAGMQYKGKGTGLGLAICHEIVSLHGGRVGVRSAGKAGEGAEFLLAVRLPVLQHKEELPSVSWADQIPYATVTTADRLGPSSPCLQHQPPADVPAAGACTFPAMTPSPSTAARCCPSSDCPCPPVARVDGQGRPPALSCLRSGAGANSSPLSAGSGDHCHRQSRSGVTASDVAVSDGRSQGPACDMPEGARQISYGAFNGHAEQPPGAMTPWIVSVSSPSTGDRAAPLVSHASASAVQPLHQPTCPAGTLRLLIVDDVLDSRRLLSKALVKRLHALAPSLHVLTEEAEDGHVAVAMATRPGGPHYDVITMDAEMPVMSGFDATKAIRSAGLQCCILGCTGNALEEDQALFRSCGVDDVFIKPLDIVALAKGILHFCAKGGES